MQDEHVHLPLEANKEPTSLIQSYFCLPLNTAYRALCMFFKKCCQQIQPAINLKYFLFKDSTCSQFIQLCGTEALGHLLMMSETWSWNGMSAFYILLCWEEYSSIHVESTLVRVFLFLVLQWVFCNISFLYNKDRKRGLVYEALEQVAEGIDLYPSGRVPLAERA